MWAKQAAQIKTVWRVYIGLWLPTYCLLMWLMKKQKQPIIHVMLKHYFCKYTIDRDTLFWGCYSLSFICGHIGLCAFTFILVDQFCIMFYPCPSVFPSIMFWFPLNNLSLPWTWSNVWNLAVLRITKGLSTLILIRVGASMSHVHLFFILLYFLLVKYRIKIHV